MGDKAFSKWIESALYYIFGGNIEQTQSITDIVTQSPKEIFGQEFWQTITKIGTTVIIPFALVFLSYFVAAEFYNLYCRTDGKLTIQIVSSTGLKLVLPYFLLFRSYDIMQIIFNIFGNFIKEISSAIQQDAINNGLLSIPEIMEEVNKMGFFDRMCYWLKLMPVELGMGILSICIFIVVYGRVFQMALFWVIAPIPISAMGHNEFSAITKNFVKNFMALMLQGALLILCVGMYSALSKSLIVSDVDPWNMLGLTAVLVVTLFTTGQTAKSILNAH